jgi:hypothetical protein
MVYIVAILLLIINFWLFNVTGLIITLFLFAYISFARHYVLYNMLPYFNDLEKNNDIYNDNYLVIKAVSTMIQKYIEVMPIDKYRNYKYYNLGIYISSALTFIPLYIAKTLIKNFLKDNNQNEL